MKQFIKLMWEENKGMIIIGIIALIVNIVIIYYQYKGFRVLHPDAPLWTFFFK